MGVKNLKNGPKSGRENEKMPVKKSKKRPKIAFTGTFYFHGKKKNTVLPSTKRLQIRKSFRGKRTVLYTARGIIGHILENLFLVSNVKGIC